MSESSSAHNDFYGIANSTPDADGILTLPVIPLRDIVIFPNVITPLNLQTRQVMSAAESAQAGQSTVIGALLRDPDIGDVRDGDLHMIAVEIALGRLLRMPEGDYSVLAQGRRRVEIIEIIQQKPHMIARARLLEEQHATTQRTKAGFQAVINLFKRFVESSEVVPEDVFVYALNTTNPSWLADLVASTLTLGAQERQSLLEMLDIEERLNHVAELLGQELTMVELKDSITSQVHQEMDRSQREMYLREQMRVIQTELGEEDIFQQELNDVRQQILEADLPPEIHDKALKEFARLTMMPPMTPEVGIIRTYIEWITTLPWTKATDDHLDVAAAQRILDAQHYGLPKIKDRILEYIAVRKLAPDRTASPILCFVGPPGVGKTSLGRSIAEALGREFVRVSLGGVRDEAEIRGHRRTYIGALPGRILHTMRRAGTVNPVFMLDEIDKLGTDFRGDPAAALLEILDPEQNNAFSDHYLDLPYDLSKVMFITTANDLDPLPPALLDRLEVIEFSSYTEEEKIAIARRFLIPKQIDANGVGEAKPHFENDALVTLIREYTYEAGVRNLDREIANMLRKIARLIAEGKRHPSAITADHVRRFLGPPLYDDLRANDQDAAGVATGLAWTSVGGDVLTIEASIIPGKGSVTLTGSLGDIMQESAQTAYSYMRSRAEVFGITPDDFENFDIHVHLPEGAVPKEGPSAGITLAIAMISAFTERPVRSSIAMTGEITLRGKVLAVGGIKEKVLSARRSRLRTVIIPKANERDLLDLPKEARKDMTILLVDDMTQVIEHVLHPPTDAERKIDRARRERDENDKSDDADS